MQSSTSEQDPAAGSTATKPAGRSLVVLGSPADRTDGPSARVVRPQAAFLAQLIATARRLPQTRERRRGTPWQAVAVYDVPATSCATRHVSRSV